METIKAPVFFNYHEFFVSRYQKIGDNHIKEFGENDALCITHFPNIYHPQGSPVFESTRIVRLPRRFESSTLIPCFSEQLPGNEPAALKDVNPGTFKPIGIHNGQLFGKTSISPLSMYMTQEICEEFVRTVNDYLQKGYAINSRRTLLFSIVDVLCLGVLGKISSLFCRSDPLMELENYIIQLNEQEFKNKGIKVISPKLSGYLSLDIQIPRPTIQEFSVQDKNA